jgi:hypothetical protein
MAIYKIFPEKSATLYSSEPTLNSGIDEILELSLYQTLDGAYEVSRPIIRFPQDEINNILRGPANGTDYNAYLRLSLATAKNLTSDYTIYCYFLYNSWNVGTGRSSNIPTTTNGVSWKYTDQLGGNIWYYPNNLPNANVTYNDDGTGNNEGGGLWYTVASTSQSFNNISSKDIELDVTDIVTRWEDSNSNSVYINNGFILKFDDALEFVPSTFPSLKYFSSNTHTIYPPCLEIRWDDWIYNTGSLSVATSPNIITTLANNQSEYQQDSVQRFRINVRDQYPARAFQATSVYLNNKALPTASYYSIKDLDTEEIVVDYDTTYTKISCDPTGMYFDAYMNGLEPERYYKILIKTTIADTTLVLDDNYYFKVIR